MQFEEHVHPNVHLEIYQYHGERKHNSKYLASQDVVITTYGTLAAEFKKVGVGEFHSCFIVL